MKRIRVIALFLAGVRALFAADAPFTPANDLKGDWSFSPDPALPARVMLRHGIAIDDLHVLSASFDGKFSTAPGDVHFTPEGYQRLASQVAAHIEQNLPPQ